jgi:hypothetical protein
MIIKQGAIIGNKLKLKVGIELLIVLVPGAFMYIISVYYDLLERLLSFSNQHEIWKSGELISAFIVLLFTFLLFSFRQWYRVRIIKNKLLEKNKKLQKVLSKIKQLKGIIPICSSCKKIRDDKGFWHQVEVYFCDHTEAEFSHGICPHCTRRLYPELFEEEIKSEVYSIKS